MAVIKPNPAGINGKEKETKTSKNKKNKLKSVTGKKNIPVAKKKKSVKAIYQVIVFALTTGKKIGIERKHSKKHDGLISALPMVKHNMAEKGYIPHEALFEKSAVERFGVTLPMVYLGQIQRGEYLFYIYHKPNVHQTSWLLQDPKITYSFLSNIKNRKKVVFDGKPHRVPNSCHDIFREYGKKLIA